MSVSDHEDHNDKKIMERSKLRMVMVKGARFQGKKQKPLILVTDIGKTNQTRRKI